MDGRHWSLCSGNSLSTVCFLFAYWKPASYFEQLSLTVDSLNPSVLCWDFEPNQKILSLKTSLFIHLKWSPVLLDLKGQTHHKFPNISLICLFTWIGKHRRRTVFFSLPSWTCPQIFVLWNLVSPPLELCVPQVTVNWRAIMVWALRWLHCYISAIWELLTQTLLKPCSCCTSEKHILQHKFLLQKKFQIWT